MVKVKELLQRMVQSLGQQLQQQKSRADKIMVDWQSCEEGWNRTCYEIQKSSQSWEAGSQRRQMYIEHLTVQVKKIVHESRKTIEKTRELIKEAILIGKHGQQ